MLKTLLIGSLMAVSGFGAYTWFGDAATPEEDPVLTVYKSPTCGCCVKWADYLKAEGFTVETVDRADMRSVKEEWGVPQNLLSCHTGVIEGYVIEGHVPAEDIRRLLEEKPEVVGLSVPRMPIGSPGMEQGDRMDPYDVLAFTSSGEATVFAEHNK